MRNRVVARINRVLNNIIVRLIIHYGASFLFFVGLWRLFPQVEVYVAAERARSVFGSSFDSQLLDSPGQHADPEAVIASLGPQTTVSLAIAILAALTLTIPVSWVYRWTRPPHRYSASFAHSLLVLPIAIALVVFLVKVSLALAVSLAGIVAAVRFRTALSEAEDAVYMLITIGIGLAAGVQLTEVSFIASLAFNTVALVIWGFEAGVKPVVIEGWTIIPNAIAFRERPAPKPANHLSYNTQLRIRTTQVEDTQKAAITLLDAMAKHWQFSQLTPLGEGVSVIEFDLRLRKSVDVAVLIHRLEEEPGVRRVEMVHAHHDD